MTRKLTPVWLLMLFCVMASAQTKPFHFKLNVANHSKYTSYYNILGNGKIDSVASGKSKSIVFEMSADQPAFYLSVTTGGITYAAYKNKIYRTFNTEKTRQLAIDSSTAIHYTLTASEQVVANYNPQLRTKNFWKLDTVIQSHADDIAGADIVFLCLCDIDVPADTITKYYNKLTPAIKRTAFGKRITGYLKARSLLQVGNRISDFSLPDTSGKMIKLNDIKADYVLLDFWFSRCGPCIQSFPEIKQVYERIQRSRLEILGISIDQRAEHNLWTSTITKYQLPWIQVNDAGAELARKFAVVNYPTKVLIDKNKKIVLLDTNNSYGEFYKELEKLIDVK